MKRKKPVFELEGGYPTKEQDGWMIFTLIARNQEPVGVILTGIRTRRKSSFVVSDTDPRATARDSDGNQNIKRPPPRLNETPINRKLSPQGTVRAGSTPSDTARITLIAFNISSIKDLTVDWSWADGQKR